MASPQAGQNFNLLRLGGLPWCLWPVRPPRTSLRAAFGLLGLLALHACADPGPRRPSPSARRTADKAALFGDPSLVPTRAGERAREEVAMAREIEHALQVLPAVHGARANVELEPAAGDPAAGIRAMVVIHADSQAEALDDQATTITRGIVGPAATVDVVLQASPAPPPAPSAPIWPLVLGLLGLGFFAGVLAERARRLRGPGLLRRRSR